MRRWFWSSFGSGVLAIFLSGLVASCGPRAENPLAQTDLTGGVTEDGRAQTGASDDLELASLKQKIDVSKPENKKLTDAILNIKATRQIAKSSSTSAAPLAVQLTISLKPGVFAQSQIKLTVPLTRSGGQIKGSQETSPSADPHLRANLTCRTDACDTMIVHLQNLGEDGFTLAGEAAAVLRFKHVVVRAQEAAAAEAGEPEAPTPSGPSAPSAPSALNKLVSNVSDRYERELETVEVAWGTSRFSLDLGDAGLCPSGRLVETNEQDESLATSCGSHVSASPNAAATMKVNAALLGNDNSGDLVLRLNEGSKAVYLSVVSEKNAQNQKSKGNHSLAGPAPVGMPRPSETADAPEAADPDRGTISSPDTEGPAPQPDIVTTGFLPFDLNNRITKSWQRDLQRPEIQAAIADWAKSDRLKQFLKRVQPNLSTLVKAMRDADAPTEMIFITMIESNYFVEPGYPIEASGAGAVGPWQFMPETASEEYGMKVRPVRRQGRDYVADPCDERADLAKSTRAAGLYFNSLFSMFKKDPKLAIMAYNWGQGNVGDVVTCLSDGKFDGKGRAAQLKNEKCQARLAKRGNVVGRLKDLRRLGIDYWAVREFHMAPKESIDYVIKFVSGQFVGREPAKYGVTPPDPKTNTTPKAGSACRKMENRN